MTGTLRKVGSVVFQVFEGQGEGTPVDERLALARGDIFVVPSWT